MRCENETMGYTTPMRYVNYLFVGFFRAVFWSGGWYWRIPFLAAIFPTPFGKDLRAMLKMFIEAAGCWPDWYFYIAALASAAIVFAGRVAYLETPRVQFIFKENHPYEILDSEPNGDSRRRFLVCIINRSFKELKDVCLVTVTKLIDRDNIGEYAVLPIALRTVQQASDKRTGRFNLSSGQKKMIEVASLNESEEDSEITIHYENGNQNLLPRDRKYIITLTAHSIGAPAQKSFEFYVVEDKLFFKPFTLRQKLAEWLSKIFS